MCIGGRGWQDAGCTGRARLWEAAGRSAVSGTQGKWQDLPGLPLPPGKVRGVGQPCLQTLMFWSLLGACSKEMHMGGLLLLSQIPCLGMHTGDDVYL